MADANQRPKLEKTAKPEKAPAKAPLCQHHNGDCEAHIPEEFLQNLGVPRGLYCETEEERRMREYEETCR